jgi:hypothetical protein
MHDLCMAIKTISLEIDAYERLRGAKRGPRESFSQVVRRAHWDGLPLNARDLLEDLQALAAQHPEALLAPETLNTMARRKRTLRHRSTGRR